MKWGIFLLISIALITEDSNASSVPPSLLVDACLKEDNLEFCKLLGIVKDNSQKNIHNKLVEWGILNATLTLGSLLKIAADKRVEFVDNNSYWILPGQERRIAFSEDEVFLMFVWTMR